jgi:hypothetical protein
MTAVFPDPPILLTEKIRYFIPVMVVMKDPELSVQFLAPGYRTQQGLKLSARQNADPSWSEPYAHLSPPPTTVLS